MRSTHEVMTVVMKNWEPLVSLPALAMPRRWLVSWSTHPQGHRAGLHTQETLLGVAKLEVLILELVAVDGLATSACQRELIFTSYTSRDNGTNRHGW